MIERAKQELASAVRSAAVVLLAALALGATPAEPTSLASADRLKQVLASRNAEAVALEDPEESGRFVAALLLPEQLLVVTARCDNVAYLRQRAEQRSFRDLYVDLHGCAIPSSKFFVQDMGADGIRPRPESGKQPDIVYDKVSRVILLNGDWRSQGLDEQDYIAQFEALDAKYYRMLQLLTAALDE